MMIKMIKGFILMQNRNQFRYSEYFCHYSHSFGTTKCCSSDNWYATYLSCCMTKISYPAVVTILILQPLTWLMNHVNTGYATLKVQPQQYWLMCTHIHTVADTSELHTGHCGGFFCLSWSHTRQATYLGCMLRSPQAITRIRLDMKKLQEARWPALCSSWEWNIYQLHYLCNFFKKL